MKIGSYKTCLLKNSQINSFAFSLSDGLPIIDGQEARQRAVKSYQRAIDERGSYLTDILNRYESKRSGLGRARGTAWGALNAVTEHADHYIGGRKVGTQAERDGRRMESILTSERDEVKQTALAAALALAN